MKTALFLVMGLGCATGLSAQSSSPPPPMPPPPPPNEVSASPSLDASQLDQLLSPVALYPDPLLGTILPASTHPDQIAAAASLVSANADPATIDQQPWDDSVKALAHYPDVLTWMEQNADWTNELGTAVATQEPDVMDTIQRLRSNALASGLLVNSPQQQVLVQNNVISIVPAEGGTVYVPYYDPQYVDTTTPVNGGAGLRFGVGYTLGSWAIFGFDWRDRSVWVDHDRHRPDDWRRIANSRSHEMWHPTPNTVQWQRTAPVRRESPGIVRPAPFPQRREAWEQRTQTPGLTPTGRMTPGFERRYPTTTPPSQNGGFRPRTEARPMAPPATAPATPNAQRPENHERRQEQRPASDHRDRDHRDDDDRRDR